MKNVNVFITLLLFIIVSCKKEDYSVENKEVLKKELKYSEEVTLNNSKDDTHITYLIKSNSPVTLKNYVNYYENFEFELVEGNKKPSFNFEKNNISESLHEDTNSVVSIHIDLRNIISDNNEPERKFYDILLKNKNDQTKAWTNSPTIVGTSSITTSGCARVIGQNTTSWWHFPCLCVKFTAQWYYFKDSNDHPNYFYDWWSNHDGSWKTVTSPDYDFQTSGPKNNITLVDGLTNETTPVTHAEGNFVLSTWN